MWEMSKQETDDNIADEVAKREIRLEVKETRHGKLLTYTDNAAPSSFRGMTEIERNAQDYIATIVARFNTETVEPGRVGTVRIDETGQPDVEWCRTDAQTAAGDGT